MPVYKLPWEIKEPLYQPPAVNTAGRSLAMDELLRRIGGPMEQPEMPIATDRMTPTTMPKVELDKAENESFWQRVGRFFNPFETMVPSQEDVKQKLISEGKITLNEADRMESKYRESLSAQFTAGIGDVYEVAAGAAGWVGIDWLSKELNKASKVKKEGIPDVDLGDITWKSALDPQFWAKIPKFAIRMTPFTLSLVPAMIAGYAGGGLVAGAVGLGAFGSAILGTLGATVLSRPLEGALEAGGTYNQALQKGMSQKEADKAATSTFLNNLKLSGFDALELVTAFAPTPVKVGGKYLKPFVTGGRVLGTAAQEAFEEALQEKFQTEALGEKFKFGAPETKQAVFGGALFGGLMGGSGAVFNAIKQKTQETMPPSMSQKFAKAKTAAMKRGMSEEQAGLIALDEIAKTPNGKKIVEQATKWVEGHQDEIIPSVQAVQGIKGELGAEVPKGGIPQPNILGEITEAPTPQTVTPISEGVIPQAEAMQPKSSVERRNEIKELLAKPAKELPKGTTKIALRQELAKINKELIPQEKTLRQKIMATAIARGVSPTQRGKIFKSVGGSRHLSEIRLDKLQKILPAIQKARPDNIGSSKVVKVKTEQAIQDLKERLKVSDADYKATLKLLNLSTDKYVSRDTFITERQAHILMKAMRRKSLLGFSQIEERVKELVRFLGPPNKPPSVITKSALEPPIGKRLSYKLSSFINRTYRIERILDWLDGKDKGIMWSTFYEPLNKATDQKISGVYSKFDEIKKFLAENKIELSKLNTDTRKIAADVELTTAERIGVYLHSLNKDNLLHLKEGNKFSDELIETVKNSLSEPEMKLANWLSTYFKDAGPAISEARTYVEDKPLDIVENYFPIRLQWGANPELDYWQQLAKEDAMKFASQWPISKIPKGFTKERTGKAKQAVDLDAFSIFQNHLGAVEHYKAFAPVVSDLQMIMKSPKFKAILVDRAGIFTYQVLDKWLAQVAEIDPLHPINHAEALVRNLRVNATFAALGLNITTVLKQFVSFLNGSAEMGEMAALEGVFSSIAHPLETRAIIKQYSPQIYRRTFEREIAEARQMKGADKVILGKISPKEALMWLTTSADKLTVSSIYRGAFDKVLNKTGDARAAADYAETVIRKTQPFFDVKDLPEYYRSGEFMKVLLIFTNQLNNNFNYYRFDIAGKVAAGRISKLEAVRRLIESLIIPGLIIGAISQAIIPKDWKEATKDVGMQVLASIPLLGSYLVSGIKGFTDSSIVSLSVLNELGNAAYDMASGKWDKAALDAAKAGGYAVGLPVNAGKKYISSIYRLATDKTDDWLELIWGSYIREKAKESLVTPESVVSDGFAKLGQVDKDARALAEKKAETPNDLHRVAERDWTYTTADFGNDINNATWKYKERDDLPEIAKFYWEYKDLAAAYDDELEANRDRFQKENRELESMFIFWGRWTKIYNTSSTSIRKVRDLVEKYKIPDGAIPALRSRKSGQSSASSGAYKLPWER